MVIYLDLDSDLARVADVAQGWAAKPWNPNRQVSSATFNQRLAILSLFFAFVVQRRLLTTNPIDSVDRRPVTEYDSARALSPDMVAEALQSIDRSAPIGKRNYSLLSVLFYTGRRLSEVLGMRWGHISWEDERCTVDFPRAKSGKRTSDALPASIAGPLLDYVMTVHVEPQEDTAIWVSLAHNRFGHHLSKQAVSQICQKHLGTSKVHATRHSFAMAMEQVGAPLSEIQARLGHASASTTSRYLAALRSAQNKHGAALATLLGLD